MARQKKSFFEKITGIKKVSSDDEETMIDFNEETTAREDDFFSNNANNNSPMGDYEMPQQQQPMADNFPALEPQQNNPYQQQPNQPETAPVKNDPAAQQQMEAEGQLTIDVYQTDDDIIIKSTIAGVKAEDLDVNINNDMITIRGERKQDEEIDPENYYYQECYWGPFSRSVILPVEIIAERTEASMKNGILTLKMPKADTTRTRKIQVRGF